MPGTTMPRRSGTRGKRDPMPGDPSPASRTTADPPGCGNAPAAVAPPSGETDATATGALCSGDFQGTAPPRCSPGFGAGVIPVNTPKPAFAPLVCEGKNAATDLLSLQQPDTLVSGKNYGKTNSLSQLLRPVFCMAGPWCPDPAPGDEGLTASQALTCPCLSPSLFSGPSPSAACLTLSPPYMLARKRALRLSAPPNHPGMDPPLLSRPGHGGTCIRRYIGMDRKRLGT